MKKFFQEKTLQQCKEEKVQQCLHVADNPLHMSTHMFDRY